MYDLTIIIPHFNMPLYLKELLQSIPVRDNIQVIVIDDKSDKNIEDYNTVKSGAAFGNVVFLDNDTGIKNAGTCRNIGLSHAKGKWLLFADADDFFIEGFYDIIREYFQSDYDAVFFVPTSVDRDTMQPAARHLSEKNTVLSYCGNPTPENELRLRFKLAPPWSKMVSRRFVEKNSIRFHEVMAANDLAFSTMVGFYMQTFSASEETIYCVTNSPGTLTKVISEENYDARLGETIWRYCFLRDNISKKDFRSLGLCGIENLLNVIKYGFGLKKLASVYKLLRRNKISTLTWKYLNPVFLIRGLTTKRTLNRDGKRFMVKQES